jgi:hypothetical protein
VSHEIRILVGIAFVVSTLVTCDGRAPERVNPSSEDSTHMSSITDVLEAHTAELMAIPGVVGTGIGEEDGEPCILVLVAKKDERLRRQIPTRLGGFRVRIDETGEVRPVNP